MDGQTTGGSNAGDSLAGGDAGTGGQAGGGQAGAGQGGEQDAGTGQAGQARDSLPSRNLEKGQAGSPAAPQGDADLDKKDQGKGEPAAPAQDAEDQPIGADFRLDIEGADPALAEAFAGMARNLGLTPRQARGLASWQLDHLRAAREAMVSAGREELAREWGGDADSRRKDALTLIARVDRDLAKANSSLGDHSFSSAIAAFGVDCNPAFVRGIAHLAALIAEDSIGAPGNAGAGQAEESVLDGLREVYSSYRKKR